MKPETTYPAIIGRILARERNELRMDQTKMAAAVGINRSSWSRIENGEIVPNAVLLDRIARVFGKNPSDILLEADEARARLQKEGVTVHGEKPPAKSDGKKVGLGLALLGAAALGGLVANALAKNKEGEDSSDNPGLPHHRNGGGND